MKILRTLNGEKIYPPPIWMMRQAGRYLPEYQKIRRKTDNFVDLCLNSELASEITLQPIRRFNLDASIIFSDILLVLLSLDVNLSFRKGIGPVIERNRDFNRIDNYNSNEFLSKISSLRQTISTVKKRLPNNIPLIGFSGAPWTLITYLIEGGSSKDFNKTRHFLYSRKEVFKRIMSILVEAISDFLILQAESGVDILMLFDTWASSVPESKREQIIFKTHNQIVNNIRSNGINLPIISFPKGISSDLINYSNHVEVDCIGIDQITDIFKINKLLNKNIAIQGNLDPVYLINNNLEVYDFIDKLLEISKKRPYIFNLGHGILPNSKISMVEKIITYIRHRK